MTRLQQHGVTPNGLLKYAIAGAFIIAILSFTARQINYLWERFTPVNYWYTIEKVWPVQGVYFGDTPSVDVLVLADYKKDNLALKWNVELFCQAFSEQWHPFGTYQMHITRNKTEGPRLFAERFVIPIPIPNGNFNCRFDIHTTLTTSSGAMKASHYQTRPFIVALRWDRPIIHRD